MELIPALEITFLLATVEDGYRKRRLGARNSLVWFPLN